MGPALVFIAAGVVALVLTLGLAAWSAALQRSYSGPNTILFARAPIFFTICGVVLAGCLALTGVIVLTSNDTNIEAWSLIIGLTALILALLYLAPTFRFFVIGEQGMTSQWFLAKKTLPWQAIDWMYPSRKTVTNRAYGIPVSKSTVESLLVAAGPKQVIAVPTRDGYFHMKCAPQSFVRAIQQRASHALVGYDKAMQVQQRRAMVAQMAQPGAMAPVPLSAPMQPPAYPPYPPQAPRQ